MKNFKFIIYVQLFFIAAVPLFAQELLTLDDAIAAALKKNQQIQIFRNTAKISSNNAHLGNAGFLPQINASAGVNYSDAVTQTAMGPAEMKATVSSAQLDLTYNLFDGLGSYYTYRKLKSQSQSSSLSARNGIEGIIVQTAAAYYALAVAEDGAQIAKEGLTVSVERLQRVRKRSDFGQANKLDLLNAEVDLNTDSVTYMNALQQLKESRQNLNVLLGLDREAAFAVSHEVSFTRLESEQDLLDSAFKNNASFLQAKAELKGAQYERNKSWSSHLPRLDLRGSYGRNQYAQDFNVKWDDPQKSASAGLSLSLNLFDGFKRSTQTQNAKIGLKNRELQLEQARLNLKKDLSNAFSAYQNKRAVLKMEEKSAASAELNFKRTKELFDLGRLTNTQFREAQLNLVRVKYSLSQAKFQAKTAEINLLRLSGILLKAEDN